MCAGEITLYTTQPEYEIRTYYFSTTTMVMRKCLSVTFIRKLPVFLRVTQTKFRRKILFSSVSIITYSSSSCDCSYQKNEGVNLRNLHILRNIEEENIFTFFTFSCFKRLITKGNVCMRQNVVIIRILVSTSSHFAGRLRDITKFSVIANDLGIWRGIVPELQNALYDEIKRSREEIQYAIA